MKSVREQIGDGLRGNTALNVGDMLFIEVYAEIIAQVNATGLREMRDMAKNQLVEFLRHE